MSWTQTRYWAKCCVASISKLNHAMAELIVPESWPTAMGQPAWIEEVWLNYISNGLKYGGQPPRLELGANLQSDNVIRFWVRDNGPGIRLEDQIDLFKAKHRANDLAMRGDGLGPLYRAANR